ncbi:hypothetical protein EIP86_007615 [Pleurotus ostreatoroseus]|nr:hypothetical protein EIP86_007615 [Pleurotus ostreatoroseus]
MTFASLTAFVILSLAAAAAAALGPVTDMHIVNKWVSPDGFGRNGVLAEGQFPGPPILAQKGQKFRINVLDELTNSTMLKSTAIHWHGLFQHGTNWADGVASVTQCPITTGDSFVYQFQPTGQADPYLHLYDVDDESTIITLADWYHHAGPQITFPPTADATLINGLGRYAGGPASPLSVITVEHGKRYRMRLVSISCDPNFTFSIDNHDMTFIEVDGVNHQPVTANAVQVFAGQRYSFILNANQPVGNYWVRSLAGTQPNQPKLVGFDGGINSAILRYKGAPAQDPKTQQQANVNLLQETDLHPLVDPAAPGKPFPGGADKAIPLNLTLDVATKTFFINNATYNPPNLPVLLQILSGAKTAQELLPPGAVYTLPKNSVIELTINPGTALGGPHPFHLHGHTFSVIRSANSTHNNYVNPVRRDVVSIGTDPNQGVTIRFTTDNPGPWFFHCHIDWHLQAGLAVVMAEDVGDVKAVNPVPQEWSELCPKYMSLPPGDQ